VVFVDGGCFRRVVGVVGRHHVCKDLELKAQLAVLDCRSEEHGQECISSNQNWSEINSCSALRDIFSITLRK
jgi:hypothetical protein